MHFDAAFGDGEIVDRSLFGLAVELELEPVFEEGLKHQRKVVAGDVVCCCVDVVLVGVQPGWAAYDLIGLNLVGDVHESSQGEVVNDESAGGDANVAQISCVSAETDRRHFDLGSGCGGLGLSLGGAESC